MAQQPEAPTPAVPARDGAFRTDRQPVRSINSETLFDGAYELQIEHRGMLYRLRRTSLGKLILTK
jgi:hemin uptake protein HemP